MNSTKMPLVFISYGREDEEMARKLFRQLDAYGASVWMDIESILPGSDWKRSIHHAIKDCRYFVVLLSESSVNRRGYVNVEILSALEVLKEFPKDQIFVIPIRLNECNPTHSELSDLNWLDLFPDRDKGFHKLLQAIGLSNANLKSSIFDVTVCGRCGWSDLKAVERRREPWKGYCLVCKKCGWDWIGPDHLSDDEKMSLRARFGDIHREILGD